MGPGRCEVAKQTDGWMDGWMDGGMEREGWMDGWRERDGWMDGWVALTITVPGKSSGATAQHMC